MTTPAATARLRSSPLLKPLALISACVFWAYWPAFVDLAQTWYSNPQYSHGFLVPVFAGFLLWMRRDRFDVDKFQPSFWGLVLLGVGLSLRLLGAYRHYVSLDAISLLPTVAGIVFLVGGMAAWRWAWPGVMFLAFMIPLPYFVAVSMSGPLQRLATITSTFVMQTFGLPALAEGNVILLNEHNIGIVEACSGLRMLVVFFALSTAMVLVVKRHWMDHAIILLSAVPIAIIANIVRVTVTGVMYELGYSEMANHFFHDVAGYVMMPLALGMLWVELKVLEALFIDAPAPLARRNAAPARRTASAASPRAAAPRTRQAAPAARPIRDRKNPASREQSETEVPVESSAENA